MLLLLRSLRGMHEGLCMGFVPCLKTLGWLHESILSNKKGSWLPVTLVEHLKEDSVISSLYSNMCHRYSGSFS